MAGLRPWRAALREQAGRLRRFIEAEPGLSPAEVGWSLAASRTAHSHRAAVIATDRRASWTAWRPSSAAKAPLRAWPVPARPCSSSRPGSQWTGMALELIDASEEFAEHFYRCAAAVERYTRSPWRRCCAARKALRPWSGWTWSSRCCGR
ncbi:hypothetical protein NKH77_11575 [Streptomyces sp. M19]